MVTAAIGRQPAADRVADGVEDRPGVRRAAGEEGERRAR